MKLPAALSRAARTVLSGRVHANRYSLTVVIGALGLIAALPGGPSGAQESTSWKTGAALETQLKQRYGIQWQDRPLRAALERLARESGAAVFLDRRIDPDQPVTLASADLPLDQLYERIAAAVHASSVRIGPVTYFGTPAAAARLTAFSAHSRSAAAKLPADLRGRVLRPSSVKWPELSEPRSLVGDWAQDAGLAVTNLESIPHDLWPTVELPPLAWTDRMALVLAGFDLGYEIDAAGRSLRLTALPAGGPPAPAAAKKAVPKAPKASGRSVYTLRAEGQPIGSVLKTIANSLGKELIYDPAVIEKLRQPVAFDLRGVSLEQLLAATLENSGLSYAITEKELRVTNGQ